MKYTLSIIFTIILKITFAQKNVIINPLNQGVNAIEYAENIDKSIKKLQAIKSNQDSVFVVLHIGDSHIQMDYFSRIIKNNLQEQFGNKGDGILFPYSACKSVGPRNLKSKIYGTWEWNNVLNNPQKSALGVVGYSLKTNSETSSFNLRFAPDSASGLDKNIKSIKIFHGKNNYYLRINDSILKPNNNYYTLINNDLAKLELLFTLSKQNATQQEFALRGIQFTHNQKAGVEYHHCGIVGAQFVHLINNTPFFEEDISALKPDLIIFSFGSNESYNYSFDTQLYKNGVIQFIEKIKKQLPDVQTLITTTPDTRSSGRFPKHTKVINQSLREIAQTTHSALWDLHAVMGGNNAIQSWLSKGWSMRDRLHFTRDGYYLQGNMFSLALFDVYNKQAINKLPTDSLYNLANTQIQTLQPSAELVTEKSTQTSTSNKSTIKHITYKVKKGDTLFKIARKFKTTEVKIKKLNHLKSNTIGVGEVLRVR